MGTMAKKIITLDSDKLIKLLNKALADEWLAYYQYWIGSQVVKGPMRVSVIAELQEHATDELRHAQMIVNRIKQLEGTPLLKPEDWYKETNCGYLEPIDFYVQKILVQNIKGEQCAIKAYQNLIELTHNKDIVTYDMASQILADEIEHEDDLESILEDIQLIKP